MHIGILVTNTDDSGFARRWPRDGEKFTRLMQGVKPSWTYSVFNCVEDQFPERADACDGYIIGGSPASVHDNHQWVDHCLDFIRDLHEARWPMAGCCFGHQAIAQALGGEVERNPKGWGFGVAHSMISTPQPWMQPALSDLALYSAHNEIVTRIPAGATVTSGGDHCPIGGFVVGRHIMTTQHHPEMTKDFFLALIEAFAKYLGDEIAAEARRQAREPAQGPIFAEWMARFFELARG